MKRALCLLGLFLFGCYQGRVKPVDQLPVGKELAAFRTVASPTLSVRI